MDITHSYEISQMYLLVDVSEITLSEALNSILPPPQMPTNRPSVLRLQLRGAYKI